MSDRVASGRVDTRRRVVFVTAALACLTWAIGGELISFSWGFGGNHLLEFLSGLAYLGAGLFALYRRPGNVVGVLLLLYGALWFLGFWTTLVRGPVEAVATVVASAAGALLVHLALAFPDGRTATRFGRGVVIGAYAWNLLISFTLEAVWDRAVWTREGFDCSVVYCRATLSFWPSEQMWDVVRWWANIGSAVTVVLTVVAFWQRWRLSTAIQRRDLRLIWIPVALVSAAYAAEAIAGLVGADSAVFAALLEFRSLVQLIAPLIIVYGLVNARHATSAVGEFVREIREPLGREGLEAALAQALDDPGLRVHFPTDAGAWSDAVERDLSDPRRTTLIVSGDGTPRAALVHDPGLDERAVEAAAAAAGLALENEALHAAVAAQLVEVEASRARIVAAGDAERKRVERDLHDGAQQRLLALAMSLREAQRHVDDGTGDAGEALRHAESELRLAIDELRELARGIHPAILTDAGLGPAVRSLADRSPVAIAALTVPDSRLPAAAEAAAYFVVAESLANVAKHAAASRVTIVLRADGDVLHVEVTDDGVGGADPVAGSGLRGLEDRVASAGGRLRVATGPEGGTTVRAGIPISHEVAR